MQLPAKMQEASSKSTDTNRRLFDESLKALKSLGLPVYSTDTPYLCVKHPINNMVFCALWFLSRAGVRYEIRVDGCPKSVLDIGSVTPSKMRQYDGGSRARWAVFPVKSKRDIDAAIGVARNVMKCDPAWGR